MAIGDLPDRPAPRSRPIKAALWYAFAIALFIGALLFIYSRIIQAHVEQGRRSACATLLSQLDQAIARYRHDMDQYPSTKEGLEALTKGTVHRRPIFVHRVNGEIQSRILDPWDHPFVYIRTPGPGEPFVLYSVGPNGVDEGGKGDDLSNED